MIASLIIQLVPVLATFIALGVLYWLRRRHPDVTLVDVVSWTVMAAVGFEFC
jgi:uncharacterized BrkB/YihY/UPF0761 family membrane protein